MRSRKPSLGIKQISRRAARLGIETQLRDAQGVQRIADPEALARVVAAMAGSHQPARRVLPRTVVVRHDQGPRLCLRTDARTAVRWEIFSNANFSNTDFSNINLFDAKVAAGTSNSATIELSGDLPLGTYRLKVAAQSSGRERIEEATLLRAPRQAFQG